jgi:hypothetical protein
VGLCNTAANLHLHFLKNAHHNKLTDVDIRFPVEERSLSVFQFNKLL